MEEMLCSRILNEPKYKNARQQLICSSTDVVLGVISQSSESKGCVLTWMNTAASRYCDKTPIMREPFTSNTFVHDKLVCDVASNMSWISLSDRLMTPALPTSIDGGL